MKVQGPKCPPAWDSLYCWPPTTADSEVSFPCERIFPFLNSNSFYQKGAAYRVCNGTGAWSWGNWTNYSECVNLLEAKEDPISPVTVSYVMFIGSITSLLCLGITLFIFSYFASLQCSRIRVHKNLVLSLILHSFMLLTISLSGLFEGVAFVFQDTNWFCKSVLTLKMYSAMTCIHWMFVEGLLLHSSITVSVFQQEAPFKLYYSIGWGIPLVCVSSWVVLMSLFSTSTCWRGYGDYLFIWIITGPMIIALIVNAVFLVNIIRILVTKLRMSVSIETKQVKKAMKATALLFPLLGITHLLFCINPKDDAYLEHAYMLTNAVLQSSQGLFVAVLYCFLNTEVQSVLTTAYSRSSFRRDPRRSCCGSQRSRVMTSMSMTSSISLPNGSCLASLSRGRVATAPRTSPRAGHAQNLKTLNETCKEMDKQDLVKETRFCEKQMSSP